MAIFNLTKMMPFLSGIVGGTFDAVATKVIGNAAKRVFTRMAVPVQATPVVVVS
jgi:hypothetical protein